MPLAKRLIENEDPKGEHKSKSKEKEECQPTHPKKGQGMDAAADLYTRGSAAEGT
jgi:hypothetical protein